MDGASSVAYANLTVLAEQDYPPTAHAGNPKIIYLPTTEVYLYGNKSTDDKVGELSDEVFFDFA